MFKVAKNKLAWLLPFCFVVSSCGLTNNKTSGSSENTSGEKAADDKTENSDPPFTPTDNDAAVEPTEVNGSFLTDLSCMITNQSDTDATDTAVTCKLINGRGEKFPGKVEGLSAKIAVANSTTEVSGAATVLDTTASDSFVAIFPGVSPKDALGIIMTATLDGKPVNLQSAFALGSATVSIANKDLYISADADEKNSACTIEAPCKSIRRALLFVPDIIGHDIILHIAEGHYPEAIKISGKTIKEGGKLELLGRAKSFETGKYAKAHLTGDFTVNAVDPVVGINRNVGTGLRLDNIEVESCTNFGFLIDRSSASFGNISIAECKSYQPLPARARSNIFLGFHLTNGSQVKMENGTIEMQNFIFPTYTPTFECNVNIDASNPACKILTTIGITIGYGSTLTLFNSTLWFRPQIKNGINLNDDSTFSVRSEVLSKIKIDNAVRGISVLRNSTFKDFNSDAYPTQDNRLFIEMKSVSYGFWVESGGASLQFADLHIDLCKLSCLYSSGGGKIEIGRDNFAQIPLPREIYSKLVLNTVSSSIAPVNEGYVVYADTDSKVSIQSTVTDILMCHSPLANKPVIEAGFKSDVLLRLSKTALSSITTGEVPKLAPEPCATVGEIGGVSTDLGTIAISSGRNKQTQCANGSSFLTCVSTEIAN